MSIKKSLIAFAATALALMGLASSAMAGTGTVVDVGTLKDIPANRELHFIGWAKFTVGTDSYQCHVTAVLKATPEGGVAGKPEGRTADVTQFTVPDLTKCTGAGQLEKCKLKGFSSTGLPYHVTATETDFDLTGSIVIHNDYEQILFTCNVDEVTLTFSSITLKPLKTGVIKATGTAGKLGTTAAVGDPIAGAEISGVGEAHIKDIFGGDQTKEITTSGELELTEADRCTWKLVKAV